MKDMSPIEDISLEEECRLIEDRKRALTTNRMVRDILYRVDLHYLKDSGSYIPNMHNFLSMIEAKQINEETIIQLWNEANRDKYESQVICFIMKIKDLKLSRGFYIVSDDTRETRITVTESRVMEL